MLTQVYTSRARAKQILEIDPAFYLSPPDFTLRSRSGEALEGSGRMVTGATHDTWVLVKTSKFARVCSMLLPELGNRHHTGRITDMARHTKIKLAALATTLVAALGIVAVCAGHRGRRRQGAREPRRQRRSTAAADPQLRRCTRRANLRTGPQPGGGCCTAVGLARGVDVADVLEQVGELEPQLRRVAVCAGARQQEDRVPVGRLGALGVAARGQRPGRTGPRASAASIGSVILRPRR